MTNHNSDKPDTSLPEFSINLAPIKSVGNTEIRKMINYFRTGETEPLIIGDDNPEAVVIPFEAFVRLMRYDHAHYVRDEHTFAQEVSRRIQRSEQRRASGEDSGLTFTTDEELYTWIEDTFGDIGEELAAQYRAEDAQEDQQNDEP